MKKLVAAFLIVVSYPLTAQISWSPYALVEESVHIGDVRPSYNYANLNVSAANAGIRVGAFISSPTAFSGEMTLGVVGLGSPGTFTTNMIPVEVVGHLNTLQLSKTDIRFNLDFGAGIALAENSSTYYNLNRNAVLGLSLEFPRISKFESLILGVRYVSNSIDFLDKSIAGSDNDATLRFYTAVRFDGRLKADTKNIDDINKLLLENIQFQKTLKEKEIENALLQDVIKAYSKSDQDETKIENDSIEAENDQISEEETTELPAKKNATTYAIIIASFGNLESANKFVGEYQEDCEILFDEQSGNYRIAYKVVDSIDEATEVSRTLRDNNEDNWILRL
jgi:hypothetical protein